jgi:hypothetical protein
MLEGKKAFNDKDKEEPLKPSFFVRFDAEDSDFEEAGQARFLEKLSKFSNDNGYKARMLDEKDTEHLRPGVNIVVKMTGSLDPESYGKIVDSFIKVLNKSYPKLMMEKEYKPAEEGEKDHIDRELEDMISEYEKENGE